MIPRQVENQNPALLVPSVPCLTRDREASAVEGRLLQAALEEQQNNSTTTRQLLPLILSSYTVMPQNRTICHRGIIQLHQGFKQPLFPPIRVWACQTFKCLVLCHADGDYPGRCVRKKSLCCFRSQGFHSAPPAADPCPDPSSTVCYTP